MAARSATLSEEMDFPQQGCRLNERNETRQLDAERAQALCDEILGYAPERPCRCPIDKWALLRLSDVDNRLLEDGVRERVSLVASDYRHLNLAVHNEMLGFRVVYEGRLATLRGVLLEHLDDVERWIGEIRRRRQAEYDAVEERFGRRQRSS